MKSKKETVGQESQSHSNPPKRPCGSCGADNWYWLDAGKMGGGWRCVTCHPPVKPPDPVTRIVSIYG